MAEMILAIKKVASGDIHISSAVSTEIARDIILSGAGAMQSEKTIVEEKLSGREMDVFRLLADGKSYKETSDELSISYKTVETHRASIFQKLELKNIAELVKLAIKEGIITLD